MAVTRSRFNRSTGSTVQSRMLAAERLPKNCFSTNCSTTQIRMFRRQQKEGIGLVVTEWFGLWIAERLKVGARLRNLM